MSFGQRLKERREYLKITRAELAKKLDVTVSSVGNYENGVSSPKEEILYKIFEILDVEPNYLWQDEMQISHAKFVASLSEQSVVEKYRRLDEHGKKLVDMVLDTEYQRITKEEGSEDIFVAARGNSRLPISDELAKALAEDAEKNPPASLEKRRRLF